MWWLIRELVKRFSRFNAVEVAIQENRDFELKSREEICNYQLIRLNELWQFACANVPYYRNLQNKMNLPLSFTSLKDALENIPVLEKLTVQANPELFLPVKRPSGFWARTSGSTGRPMKCYWEKEAYVESQRNKYYHQSLWGIDVWDKTALLWGYSHFFKENFKGKIKVLKDYIVRKIRNRVEFPVYQMSKEDLRNWYKQIQNKKIRFLYALPNVAYLLAKANEKELPPESLKLVIVGGEPLFPYQKNLIEQVMGCPVVIEYGTIEIGLLAASYPDSKIHVCEKGVILETVATPQGTFEIIVTNLRNKGFPLIRYRIGDFVESPIVFPDKGTATLGSIIGRTRDVFVCASGTVLNGLTFSRLFKEFHEIVQYQVIQEDINRTVVRFVCWTPLSEKVCCTIKLKLSQLLGQNTIIELQEVERIEPTAAGKHKFIISNISTQALQKMLSIN